MKIITLTSFIHQANSISITIINTVLFKKGTKINRVRTNNWKIINHKFLIFFFTSILNRIHSEKKLPIWTRRFKTTCLIPRWTFHHKTSRKTTRFFLLKIFLEIYFISTTKFFIKLIIQTTIRKRILITNSFELVIMRTW